MRAQRRAGRVRDSAGCGGFGVFLSGLGLAPGFDEGSADDAGADEGDLGYYSVGLRGEGGLVSGGVLHLFPRGGGIKGGRRGEAGGEILRG